MRAADQRTDQRCRRLARARMAWRAEAPAEPRAGGTSQALADSPAPSTAAQRRRIDDAGDRRAVDDQRELTVNSSVRREFARAVERIDENEGAPRFRISPRETASSDTTGMPGSRCAKPPRMMVSAASSAAQTGEWSALNLARGLSAQIAMTLLPAATASSAKISTAASICDADKGSVKDDGSAPAACIGKRCARRRQVASRAAAQADRLCSTSAGTSAIAAGNSQQRFRNARRGHDVPRNGWS